MDASSAAVRAAEQPLTHSQHRSGGRFVISGLENGTGFDGTAAPHGVIALPLVQNGFTWSSEPGISRETGLVPVENQADLGVLVQKLVGLAAFAHDLLVQSHLLHLNIEGPLFLPLHQFLQTRYEAHLEDFDRISELVRALDALMPATIGELRAHSSGFTDVSTHERTDSLIPYVANLERFVVLARQVESIATAAREIAVANVMADLVDATAKAAWFLKASLR